ncbi:hypothetical protein VdG1_01055 [Verticillium dahliae VDG1]|nr:hypothetical protein VdG1_01055 [Verticillium dahliae VDG1]
MTNVSPVSRDDGTPQMDANPQAEPNTDQDKHLDKGKGRAGDIVDSVGTNIEASTSRLTAKEDAHSDEEDDKNSENDKDEDEEDEDEDEDEEEDEDEDDEEDEDEEDEEPRLKYARLTQHLGPVYRNGDATSAFLVAGDKMIIGTHNGNIHVIQLPMFQTLRVYHAHSASVTAISISPYPPPLPTVKTETIMKGASQNTTAVPRPGSRHSEASPAAASRRSREPHPIPNSPSNNIHIATSSMDGNVCVQSLVDLKDVQLRNFARPVQAVAISPDYRNDRTYLSGGTAGQLILTVGGPTGRSTSTTIGTAAAAASGWLGSMGLGTNTGRDTVLHSGEGTVSNIKWSLSGKYVVWLNETGVKIMRSNSQLQSTDSDDAWKRIGHVDRPQTDEWEAMAGVWKGRIEWIDEQTVEVDDEPGREDAAPSIVGENSQQQQILITKKIERLIVGWGGTIWIIHVHSGGIGTGVNAGEKSIGRAEIAKHLRMDCTISGISLYSQNLLLVLAYGHPEGEDDGNDEEERRAKRTHHKSHSSAASIGTVKSEPSGGIRRRQNNPPPELRLIDLASQSEVDKDDGLIVSRYERLSSGDYHLGVLPARNAASAVASSKGALESLAGFGNDVWNAAINPKSLFSSGVSIKSKNSNDGGSSNAGGLKPGLSHAAVPSVHPNLLKPGSKIFIHSPYDCILATKRDLGDHLNWLLEHHQYQKAWELLDDNPDIMAPSPAKLGEVGPPTPDKINTAAEAVFDDASSAVESVTAARQANSTAQKEKQHIGELWIRDLVEAGNWVAAGQVCAKVLGSSDRWEKWVWNFASANKFDDIAQHIPAKSMHPPLSSAIYEVVLNHYIQADKVRFRDLLDRWPSELFDINTVTTALENQLKYRDVREDSVEAGERGRDWRIVMESLAKLHELNGRYRESLKCHIKLQDADSAFRMIRENHLADAVVDDIPSFIGLRVPSHELNKMSEFDLEEATSEAITLLVDEAQHGLVRPATVVAQLEERDLTLFLYFYLRGLYKGEGIEEHTGENRERLQQESKYLVDDFADKAVQLFAKYDRSILMDFLRSSTSYAFEKAAQECERYRYDDELVYLYSKTGQMKRALFLIIDRLKNVKKAIEFAKEQDDPDLWSDLLDYSMDKPKFIRGLLEQVGTSINPITLVRRIPEGLEIEGLREGLAHIMKEHEIQFSISSGVARVLRSEVAAAQNELRIGQRKGIKFEVEVQGQDHVDLSVQEVAAPPVKAEEVEQALKDDHMTGRDDQPPVHAKFQGPPNPGHCAQCQEAFTDFEMETLIGSRRWTWVLMWLIDLAMGGVLDLR